MTPMYTLVSVRGWSAFCTVDVLCLLSTRKTRPNTPPDVIEFFDRVLKANTGLARL